MKKKSGKMSRKAAVLVRKPARSRFRFQLYPKLASRGYLCALAVFMLFGCGATAERPRFEGERAFALLEKQVAFGPRYSGSPGHARAADFLLAEMKRHTKAATEQRFIRKVDGKALEFRNIIGSFGPDGSGREKGPSAEENGHILLCAHWDTRPLADQEVDAEKRRKPIPGANDGASGTAILLELARLFSMKPPEVGVTIVLFDGEDYGITPDAMFIGSEEFAKNWKRLTHGKSFRYGVLLDMVGDRNLAIYREGFSSSAAPQVVDRVWKAARESGNSEYFKDEIRHTVNDDHIPLLAAGIKCIDVIDFDYGPWHTLDDTIDKCSPKSLQIVGDVISHLIYSERGPAR